MITENEHAVAEWVFKNNKRAGATTGTLSEAECYYLAVRSLDAVEWNCIVRGVVRFKEWILSFRSICVIFQHTKS